jgi:hypothetical protein
MSISNPNWRIMATTLLIGAALLSACGEQPPPTPEESGVPIVVDDLAVIVDGRLNPARSVAAGRSDSFRAGTDKCKNSSASSLRWRRAYGSSSPT